MSDRRDDARDELIEFETDRLAAAQQRTDQLNAEFEALDELLLRARHDGLKNSEIADALNSAGEYQEWSTQKVTAMMSVAESRASHAVRRLIRGDDPETDTENV